MLHLYFIIGIIIFIYVSSGVVLRNTDCIKQPLFWVSASIIIGFWPIWMAWGTYELYRELTSYDEEL